LEAILTDDKSGPVAVKRDKVRTAAAHTDSEHAHTHKPCARTQGGLKMASFSKTTVSGFFKSAKSAQPVDSGPVFEDGYKWMSVILQEMNELKDLIQEWLEACPDLVKKATRMLTKKRKRPTTKEKRMMKLQSALSSQLQKK
jgi:hypothetical protein